MAAQEKVDVAIVGAGASASVFASVLARAGKKVVMLEQGPDWKGDLISSEIWGRRLKAVSPAILEGKDRLGYSYNAGWGSGGAATHYFAMFPRLLPNDFNMKSAYGRGLDWPFSYDDLAPTMIALRTTLAFPVTPKRRSAGARPARLIPCHRSEVSGMAMCG